MGPKCEIYRRIAEALSRHLDSPYDDVKIDCMAALADLLIIASMEDDKIQKECLKAANWKVQ